MRSFCYEHRFPVNPCELLRIMDGSELRDYLNCHMSGMARTKQEVQSDTETQRIKHLWTIAQFSLPARVEKIVSRLQPHVVQEMILDKEQLIEQVQWRAPFGKMSALARYFHEKPQGTLRRYEGSFECTLPLVGPVVESLVIKQIGPMYDVEADLTCKYLSTLYPNTS